MTSERDQVAESAAGAPDVTRSGAVLRRTADGWSVGDEQVPDLTCAMVLADLLAAELTESDASSEPSGRAAADVAAATAAAPGAGGAAGQSAAGAEPASGGHEEARRLRVTVSQLERALAVRIRVEQAIGVLAERHRVRPRQAFEQLRFAARARGQRVIDIAGDVIASATNPLLPLPEELSRPNLVQRQRAGSRRRARESQ